MRGKRRAGLESRLKIVAYLLVITGARRSCRDVLERFSNRLLQEARSSSITTSNRELSHAGRRPRVVGWGFALSRLPTGGLLQHMKPPRRTPEPLVDDGTGVPATPAAPAAADLAAVFAAVLDKMSQRMSLFSFRGFVEPLRAARFDPAQGELVLSAPTAFLRDWARDHYVVDLAEVAGDVVGRRVTVKIELDSERPAAPPPPPVVEPAPPVAPAPVVPFRSRSQRGEAPRPTRLNPRYTFETFVTGPSNRMAFAACTAVAEHPGARYTPLFLFGGTGLGKTHLLHAIGNEALARHPQLRIVYLTAEQWVNEYIADIHERRFEEFRRRYRDACDVLLIDDIQFLAGKNASQDEFFHTFNALYERHKQIVVTSDRYPHEIAGLEERLKTRLQWGLVADVQPPEIETRIAILQQKADELGCALPNDVAEYLATTLTSSVRELEGALVRLNAFAQITREPIDIDAVKEQLRPVLALKSAEVPVSRVIDVVASYYGLRAKDLIGPSRQRQVTRARQVAMYLVRHHLGRSLPEIGRAFGDRDHTTVLASVNKIGELKGSDAGVQAVLARLGQSLFGV
jgi:chromosomal replication initiator protein